MVLADIVVDPESSPQPPPSSDNVAFTPFRLGYDDTSTLARILEGAECVYSVVTPDVERGTAGDFRRTNEEGMRQLLLAAQQAGVPKLVYASSLAVTNHMIPSVNSSESDPLPSMDSYVTYYDRTKRVGEDMVLAANQSSGGFKTCAIRLGGIIASPTDYMLRASFEMGESSGKLYALQSKPIDTIVAEDAAAALVRAEKKLNESVELPGRALFVTKSRNEQSPGFHQISDKLAQLMGWQHQTLSTAVAKLLRGSFWMKYTLSSFFQDEDDRPGMPPHIYLDLATIEQTFDNSLAYKILDFKPKFSWEEGVESVVEAYKRDKK